MRARSAVVMTALIVGGSLGGASAAWADPKGAPIAVVCDNGNTYQVTVNGNGAFTAAHDSASTAILVPTAFGEFSGTLTDSDGNVLEEFTDPPMIKGAAANQGRATSTACTYVVTGTFEDPDLGTVTFAGTGTVTGFVTPVR